MSLAIASTVCAQEYKFTPQQYTFIDSTKGHISLHQCSRPSPKNVQGYWNVNTTYTKKLEANFKKVLLLETAGFGMQHRKLTGLEKYSYQYTGIVIKGKKYIYINAFITNGTHDLKHTAWRTEPVIECDGGDQYWGAVYDPTTGSFFNLLFNAN